VAANGIYTLLRGRRASIRGRSNRHCPADSATKSALFSASDSAQPDHPTSGCRSLAPHFGERIRSKSYYGQIIIENMRHAIGRRGKRSGWRVLTVLIAFFISEWARAQSSVPEGQRIFHQSGTFKEGAPETVEALAQTADGYLWLGTPPETRTSRPARSAIAQPASVTSEPPAFQVTLEGAR